jgi:hypothetical protein
LSGGLFKGLSLLKDRVENAGGTVSTSTSKVSSVLLFTDGLANAGISKPAELIEATVQQLKEVPDVSCFCFGFGNDHDANLLKDLAEAGKGMYYFIDNAEEIPAAFGDCLGGLVSVFAQNLTVKCHAKQDVSLVTKFYSKNVVTNADKNLSLVNDLSDLYCEEERDIVFELTFQPQTCSPTPIPVLDIEITYFNLITKKNETLHRTLTVVFNEKDNALKPHSERIELQIQRVQTAEVLNTVKQLADAGKYDQARSMLKEIIEAFEQSQTKDNPFTKMLIKDLQDCKDSLRSSVEYGNRGNKMMNCFIHQHAHQRAVQSRPVYKTKMKANMEKSMLNH